VTAFGRILLATVLEEVVGPVFGNATEEKRSNKIGKRMNF
jgi:hypothetical protein